MSWFRYGNNHLDVSKVMFFYNFLGKVSIFMLWGAEEIGMVD